LGGPPALYYEGGRSGVLLKRAYSRARGSEKAGAGLARSKDHERFRKKKFEGIGSTTY